MLKRMNVACPHCNQSMEVGEEAAAGSFVCPACGQEICLSESAGEGVEEHVEEEEACGEVGIQDPGRPLEEAPSFYLVYWGRDLSSSGPAMLEIPEDMRKLRKCPDCGGALWHRVNHGTIRYVGPTNREDLIRMEEEGGLDDDRIGKTWGYGNLMVCLSCIEVDCMIEGCEKRATVGVRHEFPIGESGSALDKPFRVNMRNDLWFCAGHAPRVKGYRMLRFIRNWLFAIGVIGLGAAFLSVQKAAAAGVGAAGMIGAGAVWNMMNSYASRYGLTKKAKYIESVQVPLELDPGARSAKEPWLDDMLYD